MPAGRPTDYRVEYCNMIVDYFNRPIRETTYKRTFDSNGNIKTEEPIFVGVEFPTMAGFAAENGLCKQTLLNWCRLYPEFMDAYTRAQEKQEQIWAANAMGGQYNSQFAQFFGKNCLGYKDKVETELSGGVTIGLADDVKEFAE